MKRLTKAELYRITYDGGFHDSLTGRTLVEGENVFDAGYTQLKLFKRGNVHVCVYKSPDVRRASVGYESADEGLKFTSSDAHIVYACFRAIFGEPRFPSHHFGDGYYKLFNGKDTWELRDNFWALFGETGLRAKACSDAVTGAQNSVYSAKRNLDFANERLAELETDAFWADLFRYGKERLISAKKARNGKLADLEQFVADLREGKLPHQVEKPKLYWFTTLLNELGLCEYGSRFGPLSTFGFAGRDAFFSHAETVFGEVWLNDDRCFVTRTHGTTKIKMADVLEWLIKGRPAELAPRFQEHRAQVLECRTKDNKPILALKMGCQRYDLAQFDELRPYFTPTHEVKVTPAVPTLKQIEDPEAFLTRLESEAEKVRTQIENSFQRIVKEELEKLAAIKVRRSKRDEEIWAQKCEIGERMSELSALEQAVPKFVGVTCEELSKLGCELVNSYIPNKL